MVDVIQLYNGTDAVSRKGMNDRFAAANEKFEAVDGKTKEIEDHVESYNQQIAAHVADTTVHITGAERTAWNGKATVTALNAVKATADAALPKAGGAMTGPLVAAGGADYTTARVRNIVCATDTNVTINDGDVLHVYK